MDWLKEAQQVMDFLRSILVFISRNWDIIGIGVGFIAARGLISQKNAEIIGRVFSRNLSMKNGDINLAVAEISKDSNVATMESATEKVEGLLADVIGSGAKKKPPNINSPKGELKDFANGKGG